MSELVKKAQKHIELQMRDLTGDQDFLPFMTLLNPQGEITFVGMEMPDDDKAKDALAATMTALCLLHNATEAAFASAAWMIDCSETGEVPKVMPSKHPNRVEAAFVFSATAEGRMAMSSANVIRENDGVGVGLWTDMDAADAIGGRFGDAIRHGIGLAKLLPPDLREFFNEEINAGRTERLLGQLARTISTAQASPQRS